MGELRKKTSWANKNLCPNDKQESNFRGHGTSKQWYALALVQTTMNVVAMRSSCSVCPGTSSSARISSTNLDSGVPDLNKPRVLAFFILDWSIFRFIAMASNSSSVSLSKSFFVTSKLAGCRAPTKHG